MSKYEKPPLGVEPAWLVAWRRIGDLIAAIERQYESQNGSAEKVKVWAEEITWQCSIIEAMKENSN